MATIILAVAWMSLLKTGYSGALPAFLAECFPAQTRATGMSLSYNIGVPIFGGFAPFYITWFIALTGSNMAPGFYMIFYRAARPGRFAHSTGATASPVALRLVEEPCPPARAVVARVGVERQSPSVRLTEGHAREPQVRMLYRRHPTHAEPHIHGKGKHRALDTTVRQPLQAPHRRIG